jgi:hypothetical protein
MALTGSRRDPASRAVGAVQEERPEPTLIEHWKRLPLCEVNAM